MDTKEKQLLFMLLVENLDDIKKIFKEDPKKAYKAFEDKFDEFSKKISDDGETTPFSMEIL